MSGSALVSTFVGLIINQAKVRDGAYCVPLSLDSEHKGHTDKWMFAALSVIIAS